MSRISLDETSWLNQFIIKETNQTISHILVCFFTKWLNFSLFFLYGILMESIKLNFMMIQTMTMYIEKMSIYEIKSKCQYHVKYHNIYDQVHLKCSTTFEKYSFSFPSICFSPGRMLQYLTFSEKVRITLAIIKDYWYFQLRIRFVTLRISKKFVYIRTHLIFSKK